MLTLLRLPRIAHGVPISVASDLPSARLSALLFARKDAVEAARRSRLLNGQLDSCVARPATTRSIAQLTGASLRSSTGAEAKVLLNFFPIGWPQLSSMVLPMRKALPSTTRRSSGSRRRQSVVKNAGHPIQPGAGKRQDQHLGVALCVSVNVGAARNSCGDIRAATRDYRSLVAFAKVPTTCSTRPTHTSQVYPHR